MVRVAEVAEGGAEIDDVPVVTVMEEPIICMGICADTDPDVPITVAVRLALFEPQEKVTVAGVVLLVTTLGALRTPASVANVTVTSDNAAFEAFNAVMVIVEVVEPSDFTVVDKDERPIEATVVVSGVGAASSLLPPQALRQQNRAKQIISNNGCENFALMGFIILLSFMMRNR